MKPAPARYNVTDPVEPRAPRCRLARSGISVVWTRKPGDPKYQSGTPSHTARNSIGTIRIFPPASRLANTYSDTQCRVDSETPCRHLYNKILVQRAVPSTLRRTPRPNPSCRNRQAIMLQLRTWCRSGGLSAMRERPSISSSSISDAIRPDLPNILK